MDEGDGAVGGMDEVDVDVDVELDDGEELRKVAKRRERNKELARKSRQKKKQELEQLQARVVVLTTENHSLTDQVRGLQRVVTQVCEQHGVTMSTIVDDVLMREPSPAPSLATSSPTPTTPLTLPATAPPHTNNHNAASHGSLSQAVASKKPQSSAAPPPTTSASPALSPSLPSAAQFDVSRAKPFGSSQSISLPPPAQTPPTPTNGSGAVHTLRSPLLLAARPASASLQHSLASPSLAPTPPSTPTTNPTLTPSVTANSTLTAAPQLKSHTTATTVLSNSPRNNNNNTNTNNNTDNNLATNHTSAHITPNSSNSPLPASLPQHHHHHAHGHTLHPQKRILKHHTPPPTTTTHAAKPMHTEIAKPAKDLGAASNKKKSVQTGHSDHESVLDAAQVLADMLETNNQRYQEQQAQLQQRFAQAGASRSVLEIMREANTAVGTNGNTASADHHNPT